jgi:hypothetical protein
VEIKAADQGGRLRPLGFVADAKMALITISNARKEFGESPASSNLLLCAGAAHIDGDLLDFGPPCGIADLNAHDVGA